jgi:hypothetical protein
MIRAGGFFATPAVYVPIEQIHHMMEIELTSGEQPAAPKFMQ